MLFFYSMSGLLVSSISSLGENGHLRNNLPNDYSFGYQVSYDTSSSLGVLEDPYTIFLLPIPLGEDSNSILLGKFQITLPLLLKFISKDEII